MGEIIKEIQVKANNEEEAVEKAFKNFAEELEDDQLDKSDIEVELIEEKKKFFGLLGTVKSYKATLMAPDKANDGYFEVSIRDDGIYLKITQPENGGKEITMDMIEEVLEEKRIVDANYNAISEALTVDGEEIKIAERRPELDRDADVKVIISNDEMIAKLTYIPPLGGKKYTAEEVIELVESEGVVFGIETEDFKDAFDPDKMLESIIIAEGKEPVEGEDAKIKFEVDFDKKDSKVNLQEDGSADYYNLNRIINVKPGDKLATKIPPKEGEPGQTVTGKELKSEPVVDVTLPVGDNVKTSEDGESIIADMTGQVVYTNEKVSVLDIHTVNGDVDLSTGNIEFDGNVVIKGNVTEGMEVKAKGNVEVSGSVYKAYIEAEGNIIIKKGFIGSSQGELKSQGSINVKFVENGTIAAEDNLVVRDAIMHSNIDSGKEIIVDGGKGLIVGGEVRASAQIDAKIIGSSLATPTEVCVGVTPELRDNYRKIDGDFQELQKELDMVIKDITLLKKKRSEKGNLSEKRQQLLNQLTRKRFKLASELEDMKAERNKLSKKINKSEGGKVRVKDKVFPGVAITIGSCIEKVDKAQTYVEFYVRDGEIKSSSYD